ncbi:MAG: hypothetical protein ABF303_14030 [Desulfobacterales bacterium]
MKIIIKKIVWVTSILMWVAGSAGLVSAETSSRDNAWRFGADLYAWGSSIGGEEAGGEDIDIDLDDILDNLELAFMGTFAVNKGKWSLAADVIYLDAADKDAIAPGLDAKVELTSWVVTPVVAYNIMDTGSFSIDLVGGARYLYLKIDLKVDALDFRGDDSGSTWDAVIGARGDINLTENFYLFGYLDIGTGESDLTWQALGGAGYQLKWFDLIAAYRYLRWDFDDNDVLDNMYIYGPAAGIRFIF